MKMIKLQEKEWHPFKVKDLFVIEKCHCGNASKLSEGNTPYIGATNKNNGVMSFVEDNPKLITKGNCIVFICDGQGSVGYSIYKKEDFIGSTTLKVGRISGLNRYSALFLTSALDKNRMLYGYGYKRTFQRLKNETILLPVNEDGKPDMEYMSLYIQQQEERLKNEYSAHCATEQANLGKYKKIQSLQEKKWKEFFVTEVFDIPKRGRRLTAENYIEGKVPVVSSAGGNNGVIAFAGNRNKVRVYENCLSVANGGVSAGYAFYHPYKFIATDHVTHFKGKNLNKYHYLFIGTVIKNQMHEKYDFSREMTDPRLQREKLLLPINDNNEPDLDYMEQYIKNLMILKYKKYSAYTQ